MSDTTTTAPSNPFESLGLTSADSVEAVIPASYWPGNGDDGIMYEGCLGFVAGPSGAGKSTMLSKVIADWTRTRGPVLWMDSEDGGSQGGMSKLRLEAAGADMTQVHYAEFFIPRDNGRLRAAVQALSAGGKKVLIVWDTADTFIEAPIQRWGKALHEIAYSVLPETGATGVLVHHTLKHTKKGMDWRAAIGGATAGIVGKSRFGVIFGARPDGDGSQRLMVPVKDSYRNVVENGAFHGIALEFDEEDIDDGTGTLKPVALMRIAEKKVAISNPVECVFLMGENSQRGPTPEKAAEAADWLKDILSDGAYPTSDVSRCMTHPDGNPNNTSECGWMSYAKIGDGSCPYCDGPVQLVQGLKESAEQDEISWGGAARKALAAMGCISDRKGSKTADSGLVFWWRLPDGHPAASTDPSYRSTLNK